MNFLSAAVDEALAELPDRTLLVFTAHSLPARVSAAGDPYESNLSETAALVAARTLTQRDWQIGWQSAGRTPEPWLGPDILDVLSNAAANGYHGVLAVN